MWNLLYISSFVLILPSVMSTGILIREDLESECMQNTSSRDLKLGSTDNMVVDVNRVIKTASKVYFAKQGQGGEVHDMGVQMAMVSSLLGVKYKFSTVLISSDYYKYLRKLEESVSGLRFSYSDYLSIFLSFRLEGSSQNSSNGDHDVAIINEIKREKRAENFENFDTILLDTNGIPLARLLKLLNILNDEIPFARPPHFGLISPVGDDDAMSPSICRVSDDDDEHRELVTRILGLMPNLFIFVGPFQCGREESAWDCFHKIVTFVDTCNLQLRNLSRTVSVGILTTTSSFGRDFWSRARFWCFLSQHSETHNWKVIMLDEDGFNRDYVDDSLAWVQDDDAKGAKSSNSNFIYVATVICAGGLVGIFLAVLISCHYKRRKMLTSLLTKNEVREFFNGNGGASAFSWDSGAYNTELEIAKEDILLDFEHVLGSGTFGTVIKGRISGSMTEVAVKMTKKHCETASTLRGLVSEIKVLSYLGRHEHVVGLLGAYTAELEKGVLYVVLELCRKGSLERHLRLVVPPQDLEYTELLPEIVSGGGASDDDSARDEVRTELSRFCSEICSGMEFLTSKRVIHGDLATRNVLLTSRLEAKIADFGLSRRLYEYTKYVKENQEPLPWRWMPPEALLRSEFSEKSDVWAFGITMWEIFSMGNVPYPGLAWHAQFPNELIQGVRLDIPELCPSKLYDAMVRCWLINPTDRPAFSELHGLLTNNQL